MNEIPNTVTRPPCFADNGDVPYCAGRDCPEWDDCHGGRLSGLADCTGGAPCTKPKVYPVARVSNCNNCAAYSQAADGSITVRLTGSIARNLHAAAEAMNGMEWTDHDNTAASLLAEFVLFDTFANWCEDEPHMECAGLHEQTDLIVDFLDTRADSDEEEGRRQDELRQAFDRAFSFQPFKADEK